jgi:hypothetical protein
MTVLHCGLIADELATLYEGAGARALRSSSPLAT